MLNLSVAVIKQDVIGNLTCLALFANETDAEWYAKNLWKHASLQEVYISFRVVNITTKQEKIIFGSSYPLAPSELNYVCSGE